MKIWRRLLAIPALAAAGAPGLAQDSWAAPQALSPAGTSLAGMCAAAADHLPPGVTLEHAETVNPAPSWRSPASATSPEGEAVRHKFCRLTGMIDGDIGFEIWLPPQDAWNGRLLGTGVGGEAGYFNYFDMARGVEQGFVTASSDTGHKRGEPWIGDPRKAENYSHIAYHRLTVVAKAIADRLYGQPIAYSYFLGCSGGARQGLRETQLYPGDYDGALLGAPGQDVPLLAARFIQVYRAQSESPASELSAADWDLISSSAVSACDAKDGITDGVIADPRRCSFSVRALECRPGQPGNCLSSAKVEAAQAIIAPLTDSQGKTYDYGLLPGITARPGGMPPLPLQMFGEVVHHDPRWNPLSFDIASDLPAARAAFPTMDASNANLTQFAAQGGKLILYHGWADASVQPEATIDFFHRLKPLPGTPQADYARLYMVPGMQHCRGGKGTDHFGASEDRYITAQPGTDMLAALIAWVERKAEPGPIEARRITPAGKVDRTRPLCPFPQKAVYRGGGSTDDAANFSCADGPAVARAKPILSGERL